MMRIVQGDFNDPRIVELLQIHLTSARAETAAGSAHALDLTGLHSPDSSFWAIWDGETLCGVGALKRLSSDHGEIKSMHTAQPLRGRGAGSAAATGSANETIVKNRVEASTQVGGALR